MHRPGPSYSSIEDGTAYKGTATSLGHTLHVTRSVPHRAAWEARQSGSSGGCEAVRSTLIYSLGVWFLFFVNMPSLSPRLFLRAFVVFDLNGHSTSENLFGLALVPVAHPSRSFCIPLPPPPYPVTPILGFGFCRDVHGRDQR